MPTQATEQGPAVLEDLLGVALVLKDRWWGKGRGYPERRGIVASSTKMNGEVHRCQQDYCKQIIVASTRTGKFRNHRPGGYGIEATRSEAATAEYGGQYLLVIGFVFHLQFCIFPVSAADGHLQPPRESKKAGGQPRCPFQAPLIA